MLKNYRMINFLLLLFIFFFFSATIELVTPNLYATSKKSSKVHKHSKKKSKSKAKKSSSKKVDTELKVSILLPEDEKIERRNTYKTISYTPETRENIMTEIVNWFDTRYKWGGRSKNGIDCSGFTSLIYEEVLGIIIPRSSREQYKIGREIDNLNDLRFGDLVFFTSGKRRPGHVGIYIGDGYFAHSSSYKKRGVVISRLDEKSYLRRYMGARRILDEPRTVSGGE